MLPTERLGTILGALLGEGRPRTIRGAACKQTAGRKPTETVPSGTGPSPYGRWGLVALGSWRDDGERC